MGKFSIIGTLLVAKMKFPFVDDERAARWIDEAIEIAARDAKVAEQDRIEEQIAKMTKEELVKFQKQCRFMKGVK